MDTLVLTCEPSPVEVETSGSLGLSSWQVCLNGWAHIQWAVFSINHGRASEETTVSTHVNLFMCEHIIYTYICATLPINIQKYKKENTRKCDLGSYHLCYSLCICVWAVLKDSILVIFNLSQRALIYERSFFFEWGCMCSKSYHCYCP